MTYQTAKSRVSRAIILLLVTFFSFLGVLVPTLKHALRADESVVMWRLLVAPVLFAATWVLWRTVLKRIDECDSIERAWKESIEGFSLFMFIVAHELRKGEVSVLLHLWRFHSEKRATREWSVYQIEDAAKTYRDGPEAFLFAIIRMCGSGHLDFSPKHYHHLVIGEAVWDVAKKKYPLSGFSVKQRGELEAAERSVESASV